MASKAKKTGLTKLKEAELLERLSKEVRFQPKELQRLVSIYKGYLKDEKSYMDAATFSGLLHSSFGFDDEFFIKRIFHVADINKDGRIDLEEFIKMTAIMLRGSRSQKIEFCFKCYDLSENNELTREDIVSLLVEGIRESPFEEVNPDEVRDLTEIILTKMDKDHNGFISFEEFKSICLDDWLYTEAFGQCLPDHMYRAAFLVLLEAEQEIDSD